MRFTKKVKPVALFAAIIVLLAGLISCQQSVTSPAASSTPEFDRSGWVGNFPPERLNLKAPAGALSRLSLSMTTGSPALSYDFPEFLDGIWGADYGENFHLEETAPVIGYGIYDWPPTVGWEGEFEAVYYFDEDDPEQAGLVFATFTATPYWCLNPPPPDAGPISAFYYEKVDADTYYLINPAKFMTEPHPSYFPDYDYGQPMYDSVDDALDELITQGGLGDMLFGGPSFDKQ
jgi:hypothetical protein